MIQLPTFLEVPDTEKANIVTPSPTPFGTKGAGEGAVHAVPATMAIAVSDALSSLGMEITELRITQSKLYARIRKQPNDSLAKRFTTRKLS